MQTWSTEPIRPRVGTAAAEHGLDRRSPLNGDGTPYRRPLMAPGEQPFAEDRPVGRFR